MKLFLFDFDGTISNSDSMIEFLKFLSKDKNFYLVLFLNSWKLLPAFFYRDNNKKLKERLLKIFFFGLDLKALQNYADDFSIIYQDQLKESAIRYIANLKQKKSNKIILITASLDIWIIPIAEKLGLELICTESIIEDNKFVGIKGENCKSIEKVRRIREKVDMKQFDEIHCFGNSSGDKEMLKISTHPHMNFF